MSMPLTKRVGNNVVVLDVKKSQIECIISVNKHFIARH